MTTFYRTSNNVATTTTGYTAGAGSLALASGAGASFGSPSPSDPIIVSTFTAVGAARGVYSCTGRTGDTLTGLTLLSGTDASLPSGSLVEMRWTAEHAGQIADAVSALEAAPPAHTHDHGALTGLADDDHAQYHTAARALTWLGTRSTADLPEGSNLYHTAARADARIAAAVGVTVAAQGHTHAIADTTGLQAALDAKAPLASPALTGTPTAPTATAGTNTTQIATTAFVLANGGGGILTSPAIVRLSGGVAGTDEVQISHDGSRGTVESKDGDLDIIGTSVNVKAPGGSLTNVRALRVFVGDGSAFQIALWSDTPTVDLGAAVPIRWAGSGDAFAAKDAGLVRAAAGVVGVTDGSTGGGGFEFTERAAPGTPAANKARLYFEDNGSGKTRAVIKWDDGSTTVLATQP